MKVISFSLYGNDPKYMVGAVRNAELAQDIYPGWQVRFYTGNSVPKQTKAQLRQLNCQLVEMNSAETSAATNWRFMAATCSDVEIVIFRDADSRLGLREKAAVQEWEASNSSVHIMRDHPWHRMPVMAGMWGCRVSRVRSFMDKLLDASTMGEWNHRGGDQELLARYIYPFFKHDCVCHDEFTVMTLGSCRFPIRSIGQEFVGEIWDQDDLIVDLHRNVRQAHLASVPRQIWLKIQSLLFSKNSRFRLAYRSVA